MGNSYRTINIETWKRKEYCQIYRNAVQPQYCVSFELDVTNFKKRIKENKWSFTMAFIYAITKCANEIEEFRYRFLDGEVVLYESIDTSFTYLDKETELFKVVNVPIQDTIEKFIQLSIITAENQKEHFTGNIEAIVNIFYQHSPFRELKKRKLLCLRPHKVQMPAIRTIHIKLYFKPAQ